MMSRLAADCVLVLHLLFVAFVCLGGLLVFRWSRVAWFHLPAAAWGAVIEFAGWICPLTPLEDRLRTGGEGASNSLGFIERYVSFVVYPEGLSRRWQIALGLAVLLVNACVYGVALARRSQRAGRHARPGNAAAVHRRWR
jgi:hypothetical protein